MKVVQKNGSIDEFDKNKIAKSVELETGLNYDAGLYVAKYVKKKLKKSKIKIVTGPLIREAVCMALLHYGYEHARYQYTRVGMPLYDAISFDGGAGTGDNANLHLSPETIHKRKADRLAKEQALLQMPKDMADMHLSGDIHIHDLEYFTTRPFCFDHDLRFTFYYGLVCDGTGEHTSVAGPAMRPEVAIMHAAKVLGASQTNCAGGQGFYNFLCFLAPYFKGMDYKTYKQCMQMFVYEMTQMLVARGGQSLRYDEILIIKDENDVISLQKIGCFCHKYIDGEGSHIFKPELKKCKTLSLNKETGELEWKFINGVYVHKPHTQLKETKITDGRAVITTSDHSLFTLDENCNFVEISPSERPDTILTAKQIQLEGLYQNLDLMFLIGACIGDGNLADNNGNEKSAIRIAVSSESVAGRITNYVSEYGFSKCEWKRPKDGRNIWETSFSTRNIPYITEIGIGASNKKIPEKLLSSNETALYSLLDGLISTDGNVSRRRYEYNTTSETLAKQIEFILMRLGLEYSFSSSMKKSNFNRNYPVYVIRISAPDSQKIHITNENRQIKSLNGAKQQKHNFVAIKSLVKRQLGVGSYKYGYTFKSNTRKLKRDDLESVSNKTPDIWNKVKNILPMEVKSISQSFDEQYVYDIGVDGNENFVLHNGIICHNTVFASVQLAPGIPKLWRDIPVVSHGKIHEDTYGNYELENRLLFKALMEVMIEGDASGKPFYFPKPEINIAPEFISNEEGFTSEKPSYSALYDLAFELAAKFGTPYFDNTTPKYRHSEGISCYQCCAYQFNSNSETDSAFDDKLQFVDGQHFSMGSWQVVTLNLPRLAYKANTYDDFINEAHRLINSCVPVFRYKRECMQKMIDNHSLGFLQQRMMTKDGNVSPIYADFDSLVYTIGVIGLNEVVAILSGTGIETTEGSKLALKICMELKKHCKTMSEFLGSTIAFARTPAETTGQRFAYLDFKAGYDVICQGDKEEAFKLQEMGISDVPIYYTNGTHVPPAANVMPSERLRIEQAFFPVLDGGNITHIWLGEQSPSVGGLKDMAMKICKTNCGYFSFTRDFTTRTRFYRLYKQ